MANYRTRFFDNQIHFGSGSLINANDIPNSTTRFWLTNSLQTISGSKIFADDIDIRGDIQTDRWLNVASNTFIGINVIGADNLAHTVGNEGYNNTIVGYRALYKNTIGRNNTVVGCVALNKNTTGRNNTALGHSSLRFMQDGSNAITLKNCTGLGYDTRVSGDNQVQLGNSATTVYTYGVVHKRSDARDKTDIEDSDLGLSFITSLRPVKFIWDYREDYFDFVEIDGKEILTSVPKDGSRKRTRPHYGLIAQEVKTVLDTIGKDFGGYQDHSVSGGNDTLSLGYAEFIAPMIKAIQELKIENDKLKVRIDVLEKQ